ncbi:MAG: hypothetical protein KKA28_10015 [Planctomycetes bacterium]|nr:hypothetical protein [Planctomycetota bacterium]MCG2684730.1 hypothetical protein [Planctomycetales bacterium]
MTQQTLFEIAPRFVNRSTKMVTFQGKLDLPIHRWYRLTPSFSPRLAADIALEFKLNENDFVLDPFSGVGTVPLCMKHRGIPSCSVEINPYLHFVGTVKTKTYSDLDAVRDVLLDFSTSAERELNRLPDERQAENFLAENAAFVPALHNVRRWWSPGNLMQLVCLRRLLLAYKAAPDLHDLLKLGLLAILIPVSNAKHNHVSLTFAETPLETVDVAAILRRKYAEMLYDLEAVRKLPQAEVAVYRGNSRFLTAVLPKSRRASAVITSPPYPNRFSYARETRPHLFFFKFIENAEAVGQLETDAIGGTWGRATSVLAAGVEPKNDVVRSQLSPYVKNIHPKGDLMASYVTKYFNDIYDHAEQTSMVCEERCRLAYVIGNSKFYDQPLPSDEILGAIFQHFGFRLDRIDKMRKRQSKSGLYEAVVFMSR